MTEDEYERFYEQIANTKIPYKYKLHYSTDVPLAIKALLYVPSSHNERMGMPSESMALHLYSRKILIKSNCNELLPPYLRFIKGVVDCEDLPLNISRETYQDTSLIMKLRNVVTRRAIKMLQDESKRDPVTYNKWYGQFQNFLKEGTQSDHDNKDALFSLLRFNTNFGGNASQFYSLDDYVAKLGENQKTIYFAMGSSYEAAMKSPFFEPFKGKDFPVIILSNQLDEFVLTSAGEYKGCKFVNVEQASIDQVRKDLGIDSSDHNNSASLFPEEDVTNFCLWLKNTLSSKVSTVKLSQRLKATPAILVGQMSSSMYMMMQMMQSSGNMPGMPEMPKDFTMEININHPTIINLNLLRKEQPKFAEEISKVFLDHILVSSSIPADFRESHDRNQKAIEGFLDEALIALDPSSNQRVNEVEITIEDVPRESILSQAHSDIRRGANKQERVIEYQVKDLKD